MSTIVAGQRFGSLVVLDRPPRRLNRSVLWECMCDCGNHTEARTSRLLTGEKRSCGCQKNAPKPPTTFRRGAHIGRWKSRGVRSSEFRAWQSMKKRCLNTRDQYYHVYGGRGIRVCDRWLESFENFLEDMGKKPSESHSLDRIDNDGNYCQENCRWATVEQQANNRQQTVSVTALGRTQSLQQWARETGLHPQTIQSRLKKFGWAPDEAVSVPARPRRARDFLKRTEGR